MRLAHAVRMGVWLLLGLNFVMNFGVIGILMRMDPVITSIVETHEKSRSAVEEMLTTLALVGDNAEQNEKQHAKFLETLKRVETSMGAENKEGRAIIAALSLSASAAFHGDEQARRETVKSVVQLSDINVKAMQQIIVRARQFNDAGVWGVVFMAICVFGTGLLFVHNLLRRVIKPMLELHTVLVAYRNGDTLRRCGGEDMPQDVRFVFNGINELLDQEQAVILSKKDFSRDAWTNRQISQTKTETGPVNRKE